MSLNFGESFDNVIHITLVGQQDTVVKEKGVLIVSFRAWETKL